MHQFPKSVRLRTRRQFQRMAHQSKRHVGKWITIESRYNRESVTRLGVTVTKRYGQATIRNRFKRIVREAFRLCREQLKPGLDLNIKPRSFANHAKMEDILNEMVHILGQNTATSI